MPITSPALMTDLAGGRDVQIIGGTMRQSNGGDPAVWTFVSNAPHEAMGVVSVAVIPGGDALQVTFAKGYPLVTFIVGPDQIMARLWRVSLGANVGATTATIRGSSFVSTTLAPINFGSYALPLHLGNIWFIGLFRLPQTP